MKRTLVSACLVLPLFACGSQAPSAEGQVVATVNGEEITQTELAEDLRDVALAPGADKQAVQNAALERLISQRLIVQAAKQEGLDKSQDYIMQTRKANNAILASLLARKDATASRIPYENEIRNFMAANPSRFSQRERISVDQIRAPRASVDNAWLKPANTLEDVAAILKAHNVPFELGKARIDSAGLDRPTYLQLTKLKPGNPFQVTDQSTVIINAITARESAPLDDKAAHDLAARLLQQQNYNAAVENRLKALKQSAKVEYRPGFSAPKP